MNEIKFTEQEIKTVVSVLSKLPYENVANIISFMQKKINEAQKGQGDAQQQ